MTLSDSGTVVITTPAWLHGDGVGHDVEGMARALLLAGHNVYVYSPHHYAEAYEAWRVDVTIVRRLLNDPATLLIHHHSIACAETEELLKHARCQVRIMRYHNVTPPEFFEGYDENWVSGCRNGRLATVTVAALCTHFSVPSLYNARDLIHAGALPDKIFYAPYFHKLDDFDRVAPDAAVVERLRSDSRLHVLFLGRRVNNKGHLHLIRTIARYVQLFDDQILLHLVGSSDSSLARYDAEIKAAIVQLGVQKNVAIYDKVSFSAITAFYREADVFLCMSEHEGFCIPIIEAEYCALPVIAYYRRGVPEALGPTQRWFTSLDYSLYAHALRELRTDSALAHRRGQDAARSVRERFDSGSIRSRFLAWIQPLLQSRGSEPEAQRTGRIKVAFVVQRYGHEVAGGAEAFARMFAERLSSRYELTVITTNSLSLDWDSKISLVPQAHASTEGLPRVIRFPPARPRDWDEFHRVSQAAMAGQVQFSEWLIAAGPDTPDMAVFLQKNVGEFDIVVNWTYLYTNAKYVADLSGLVPIISVPFFHDEQWLYLAGHAEVESLYDAFVFQTDAERSLAAHVGNIADQPHIILGAGINEDAVRLALQSQPHSTARVDAPYIVYVGRVERSKGVQALISMFLKFKDRNAGALKLVLIGRVHDCELPEHPDVVLLGFVSEAEKMQVIKNAICLVNPSEYESFSLVLLESWALGRPVLVTHRCAATTSQVARSGGGVVYSNYRDFEWALLHFMEQPESGRYLAECGRKYYVENYQWAAIIPKFAAFVETTLSEWRRVHPSESPALVA